MSGYDWTRGHPARRARSWRVFVAACLGLTLALALRIYAASSGQAAPAARETLPLSLPFPRQPRAVSAAAPIESAATHTVCPAGPPTCDYATIQDAVDAASDGDAIKVAVGTYTDLHVRPRADICATGMVTQVLYLDKSLSIEGGYSTADWVTPDPEANPTTIDPGGVGRGIYVSGDISPTLSGLRVVSGDATGMGGWPNPWIGGEEDAGGGIYVITATATIRDSEILSSTAMHDGLFLIYSDSLVEGNLVAGNHTGGVQLYSSAATIRGNIFRDNQGTGLEV
ncbi:MAG: right-handed parallel beta-helix repeat-containing protein, partial [Anaerolineae bacterium]|nr:right-handed parallel beta-helix repeat-containing protein [Anaerolineae bacterium]